MTGNRFFSLMLATLAAAGLHSNVTIGGDGQAEFRQAEANRMAIVQRAQAATLCIFSPTDDAGGGSGVVISPDGYAVTNYHVTAPCGDYLRCGMSDGHLYDAVIVGIDPTGDLALIKLTGRTDFPTAPWANSDHVRPGDQCFAVGNPFALATDFQPSVTWGIVSGVHRYQEPSGTLIEYTDCIQTDASVNPGNSGGPLFDTSGNIVGINGRCSFEKRGRVNVGVAYAISANQVQKFLGHLRSGRIVDHATAGFTVSTRGGGAVVISNILRSSDAYRRGLRDGDSVVAFDGRTVDSANTFKNILGTLPQGWRVPVSVLQDGQVRDVLVRLEGVHEREELLELVSDGEMGSPLDHPIPPPDKEPGEPSPDQTPPGEPEPRDILGRQSVPMPPAIAAIYESRRGYANYAFNRQNRDDVLRRARSFHETPVQADIPWSAKAQHSQLGAVTIALTNKGGDASFASGRNERFDRGAVHLDAATDIPASNGWLSAMFHLKRLLISDPAELGDVHYLGRSPWPGKDELCDVVVGTFETVEVHYFADTASGEIVGLEVYTDIDVDPWQVQLERAAESPIGRLPARMTFRIGEQTIGTLDRIDWSKGTVTGEDRS